MAERLGPGNDVNGNAQLGAVRLTVSNVRAQILPGSDRRPKLALNQVFRTVGAPERLLIPLGDQV